MGSLQALLDFPSGAIQLIAEPPTAQENPLVAPLNTHTGELSLLIAMPGAALFAGYSQEAIT